MAQLVPEDLRNLIVQFVQSYSNIVDIVLDQNLEPKLWFMPLTSSEKQKEAAQYFLQAAALSDYQLTGNQRNTRLLLNHLHNALGNKLYTLKTTDDFAKLIQEFEEKTRLFDRLGEAKAEIPEVLCSVNKFVEQKAKGNLIKFTTMQKQKGLKPKDFAEQLTYSVKRMNKQHASKTWLYLRWMVRKEPDLGLFAYDPRDLKLPLTTPKLRVYVALGLSENENLPFLLNAKNRPQSWWKSTAEFDLDTERFTEFAKSLFPEDPAIADFPFFILGSWLEYSDLTPTSIEKSMRFFIKKHQETPQPLMRYLTIIYHYNRIGELIRPGAFTGLESDVYEFLQSRQVIFNYEFMEFHLPYKTPTGDSAALTYKPDFLLPRLTCNGKKVLLEPHGIINNLDEFLFKLSVFRKHYGDYFCLILIVPEGFLAAIHSLDPNSQSYDFLWKQHDYKIQFENFKAT
ncbi:MAG: DUF2400 family protein [Candidatus Bathyarchaeia archaeon]|jgi:hypothetical protein